MRLVTGGTTDVVNYFQMRLLAGGDATALTITDFDLSYTRSGAATAAKVDATDLGSANAAHTDGGGFEVDPTDCPGLHRFDFPDAAFAAGVKEVVLTVKHASCFTESLRVMIDGEVNVTKILSQAPTLSSDNRLKVDTVEWNDIPLSTTNPLPNAAADAAGGLPISDAGGLDLDAKLANTHEVTAARMGALTDWINGGRLDLLLDIVVAFGAPPSAASVAGAVEAAILDEGDATALLAAIAAKVETFLINEGDATTTLQAIATAVWANVSRTLTANPGLTAGDVRNAIGMAAANLDTQLGDVPTVSEFEARTLAAASYATAAKLLSLVQSLARNDVTVDPDIGGTFSDASHSLQAIRARGDVAWLTGEGGGGELPPSAPVVTTVSPGEVISEKLVVYYQRARTFKFRVRDADGNFIEPEGTYRFAVAKKTTPDTLLFEIADIATIDADWVYVTVSAENAANITDDGSGDAYVYSLDHNGEQGMIATQVYVCRRVPTSAPMP